MKRETQTIQFIQEETKILVGLWSSALVLQGEKSLVDVWKVLTRKIQFVSKTWLVIGKNN